jgi:hypothetical protein
LCRRLDSWRVSHFQQPADVSKIEQADEMEDDKSSSVGSARRGCPESSSQAPRIHVYAERENGHWVISIRDNGEGFSQKDSEHIFRALKRLHGEDIPGTRADPRLEVAVFGADWINVPTRQYMEDIWDYMEAVAANLWLASLYTVTVPGPM